MNVQVMNNATVTLPSELCQLEVAGETVEQIVDEYISMVRKSLKVDVTHRWVNNQEVEFKQFKDIEFEPHPTFASLPEEMSSDYNGVTYGVIEFDNGQKLSVVDWRQSKEYGGTRIEVCDVRKKDWVRNYSSEDEVTSLMLELQTNDRSSVSLSELYGMIKGMGFMPWCEGAVL